MSNLTFIGSLALVLGVVYAWSFRHLRLERWQILGSIPLRKEADGSWVGLNLTYYGLINACSVTLAALLALVLLAAAGLPTQLILWVVGGLLALCAPLAKLTARLVEKKKHTFSIGGAAGGGMLLTPPLLWALRDLPVRFGYAPLPVAEILAALAAAYALGEGSGRLACISFGCCYGKPLERMPARWHHWLSPLCLVYEGATKKAAYAGGLAGCKTIGVAAITGVLYTAGALVGAALFLGGHPAAGFVLCIVVTQVWRFLSEFLRADYRGGGRLTAYQVMALAAAAASLAYAQLLTAQPGMTADIDRGLGALWDPAIILSAQFIWLSIFLYMGRSQVTAAHIRLFVRPERT